MKVIIGGAPKTGKTYLADVLSNKHGSEVIELDRKMPDFNAEVAEADFAAMLPVWQAKRDGRAPMIDHYRAESKTYWPSIKTILSSRVESAQDFIMEGAQIAPHLLQQWLGALPPEVSSQLKVIYLSNEDAPFNREYVEDAIKAGFIVYSREEAAKQF